MTTLDYSPLSSRVTGQELREFRDVPGVSESRLTGAAAIVALMAVFVVGAVVVGVIGQSLFAAFTSSGAAALPIPLVVLLIVGVLIAGMVIHRRVTRLRLLRLYRFATANGLSLRTNTEVPGYPGSIFAIGSGRT
ncbi:MAG TPA: hypothetical protein VFS93_01535, partial [Terrimesophilobacter sp.]|nr:hypothetical protein [Terrimesophilobacter sp.]